mmetsp:Transcript_121494/g.377752  ORF Transcript_121494/g.377752 Transcript_121494/m.377752 type:complete len:236 (+) Transcript_121494:126-833(+)
MWMPTRFVKLRQGWRSREPSSLRIHEELSLTYTWLLKLAPCRAWAYSRTSWFTLGWRATRFGVRTTVGGPPACSTLTRPSTSSAALALGCRRRSQWPMFVTTSSKNLASGWERFCLKSSSDGAQAKARRMSRCCTGSCSSALASLAMEHFTLSRASLPSARSSNFLPVMKEQRAHISRRVEESPTKSTRRSSRISSASSATKSLPWALRAAASFTACTGKESSGQMQSALPQDLS